MNIRSGVENAVVAALNPLGKHNGQYLRTLRVYNGDLTPGTEDEDFQRVTAGAMPAILVSTGDGVYERLTMGRVADRVFTIELLIGSTNLRSQENRFRGDSGLSNDPGIYQMLDDVRNLIFNSPLVGVAGACTARPISESAVLRSNDLSIWLATYAIRTDVIDDPLDDEDPFLGLVSNQFNFPDEDPGVPANPVIEAKTEIEIDEDS